VDLFLAHVDRFAAILAANPDEERDEDPGI
jgi:hypothetical protein